MTIIVLFGPPGSGKGTQAEILAKKFELKHVSTGDLFRYNMKNDTPLGLEAKSYIDKGSLVPDELTTAMLKDELQRNSDKKGFILDGYPRNTSQAEVLDSLLTDLFNTQVAVTLALNVVDDVLIERIKNRALDSGRVDDADESIIKNRLKVYYNETSPVANHYKKQEKWVEVQGIGKIDDITEALSKEIEKITEKVN